MPYWMGTVCVVGPTSWPAHALERRELGRAGEPRVHISAAAPRYGGDSRPSPPPKSFDSFSQAGWGRQAI